MESIMKKHIVRIILSVVALSSIAAVAVKNQKKSATSPVTATKKVVIKNNPNIKNATTRMLSTQKNVMTKKIAQRNVALITENNTAKHSKKKSLKITIHRPKK